MAGLGGMRSDHDPLSNFIGKLDEFLIAHGQCLLACERWRVTRVIIAAGRGGGSKANGKFKTLQCEIETSTCDKTLDHKTF